MRMRFFRKWLKSDTSNEESKGEHGDDFSLYLSWPDQADSSIFDTGRLYIEKSKDKNAVPHNSPDEEDDSLREDNGVDPYNTGRFDTKK